MIDAFDEHRRLLFTVAYQLLGSVADAEDVVQDAWLRWSASDRAEVTSPKAYLVRVVTHLALDRLRSARVRRETYVGPWLPEPLLTGPDVAEDVELAESVSMAVLVVLETLSPAERAVFVLREVFGLPYDEIAATLDRSEAAVRQLAHRAREHVQARRPRHRPGRREHREVTERFLAACVGGDVAALLEVLSPDVTLTSDGGGLVKAARRTVLGADKVSRFLAGISAQAAAELPDARLEVADVNGAPAVVAWAADEPVLVAQLLLDGSAVVQVLLVNSPVKLAGLRRQHPVDRR